MASDIPEPVSEPVNSVSEVSEENPNPMMNEKVLKNLFRVVDIDDLTNFRLVCKLWHKESLERWRNDKVIQVGLRNVFGHVDRNICTLDDLKDAYDKGEKEFHLNVKPYKKYCLTGWCIGYKANVLDPQWDKGLRDWFWNTFGENIVELRLNNCNVDVIPDFCQLMKKIPNLEVWRFNDFMYLHFFHPDDRNYQRQVYSKEKHGKMLTLMPKLRCIDFDSQPKVDDEEMDEMTATMEHQPPLPWPILLNCCPSLNELHYRNLSFSESIHDLIDGIEKNKKLGADKCPLNVLDVCLRKCDRPLEACCCDKSWGGKNRGIRGLMPVVILPFPPSPSSSPPPSPPPHTFATEKNGDCISRLKQPLQLKDLTTHIPPKMKEEKLSELINHYAESLKKLSLSRGCPHLKNVAPLCSSSLIFPASFDILTELRLIGPIVKDLNFLKGTPRLQVLILNYTEKGVNFGREGKDLMEASGRQLDDVVLSGMKQLRVNWIRTSPTSLGKYGKLMPNLEYLEMKLNNQMLPVVVSNWGKLKGIRLLTLSKVDDKGMTGFRCVANVTKKKRSFCKCDAFLTTRESGNIAELKDLEIFVTEGDQLGSFTEHSIIHGLAVNPRRNASWYLGIKGGMAIVGNYQFTYCYETGEMTYFPKFEYVKAAEAKPKYSF